MHRAQPPEGRPFQVEVEQRPGQLGGDGHPHQEADHAPEDGGDGEALDRPLHHIEFPLRGVPGGRVCIARDGHGAYLLKGRGGSADGTPSAHRVQDADHARLLATSLIRIKLVWARNRHADISRPRPGPAPPGPAPFGRTPMTTETMPQADQPTSPRPAGRHRPPLGLADRRVAGHARHQADCARLWRRRLPRRLGGVAPAVRAGDALGHPARDLRLLPDRPAGRRRPVRGEPAARAGPPADPGRPARPVPPQRLADRLHRPGAAGASTCSGCASPG